MAPEGYVVNWTAVILAFVVGIVAMGLMLAASTLLSPRRPSKTKAIAYESGILPTPLNWTQFNVRYYIFAILFLIFDVEAVFLFPWALVFADEGIPGYVFYAMMLFIAVLLLGVVYAWRKGVLRWR
ncbi:MAG: NADH-quinone oxidoreductase subunit A [Chloroflexota bacterium]|nr:NADH-quinone oxidoreductase subunit A [Chloroflexota bacterium]MDE2886306.1 NADH-quinone oxidoreductase subunit A [Chloroflexota bacterium]